ncbi:MAG: GNAT family N-acetyltransferase [Bacteroidia bacterium]|nr:GNAT family N-acetyltransferase [Bacteroidia bacterium]
MGTSPLYPFPLSPNCIFDSPAFYDRHAPRFPQSVYLRSDQPGWDAGASLLAKSEGYFHPGMGSYGILPPALKPDALARLKQPIHTLTPPLAILERKAWAYLHYLGTLGFSLQSCEPSFLIRITDGPLEFLLDRGNRKRLRRAQAAGLVFRKQQEWRTLYTLLEQNRAEKGATLSMSPDEIQFMLDTFPGKCAWFSLSDESRPVAAAFVLQPLSSVWQVVYWGHAPGTDHLSPVTFLAACLYEKAVLAGIHFLDLGTASLHNQPNEGLIRYKQNLGAFPSLKFSMVYHPPAHDA